MSTPQDSAAPDSPTASSPLRKEGSFANWLRGISDWIRSLSPAGKPYTTQWIAGAGNIDKVVDMAPGWDVVGFACNREGRDIDMQIRLIYTGVPKSITPNGNMENILIGTVKQEFRPRYTAALSSAHAGPLASAYVHEGGDFALAAVAPGYDTMNPGTEFSLQGMWRGPSTDNI